MNCSQADIPSGKKEWIKPNSKKEFWLIKMERNGIFLKRTFPLLLKIYVKLFVLLILRVDITLITLSHIPG